MMRVLGLIASPHDPASRYRILQYRQFLSEAGIELNSRYTLPTKDSSPAPWARTLRSISGINPWRTWNVLQEISRLGLVLEQDNYDVIWESRSLLPTLATGLIRKPVVFDIDDAVWIHEGEAKIATALSQVHTVFAGNEYLAEWSSRHNQNVKIVPTTIDTDIFHPRPPQHDRFRIGWIGTESNFEYLDLAMGSIMDFLRRHDDAEFIVISNKQPNLPFDGKRVLFSEWSAETEAEDITQFSVGIMPLTDDTWTRGKCGFKLIQYMACGVPYIASPVGFNNKLLSQGGGIAAQSSTQWLYTLEQLYNDKTSRTDLSRNGREVAVRSYDTKTWSPAIASYLHDAAGKP